jgi:hypothetical protein
VLSNPKHTQIGDDTAFTVEESQMLSSGISSWKSDLYTMRADDIIIIVDMLNVISASQKLGCVFFGNWYSQFSSAVYDLDWMPTDDFPKKHNGEVFALQLLCT